MLEVGKDAGDLRRDAVADAGDVVDAEDGYVVRDADVVACAEGVDFVGRSVVACENADGFRQIA